jgi:hypothetical protein
MHIDFTCTSQAFYMHFTCILHALLQTLCKQLHAFYKHLHTLYTHFTYFLHHSATWWWGGGASQWGMRRHRNNGLIVFIGFVWTRPQYPNTPKPHLALLGTLDGVFCVPRHTFMETGMKVPERTGTGLGLAYTFQWESSIHLKLESLKVLLCRPMENIWWT